MTWWRHQMETFSALLAICAGPHKGQWRGALMFSLIYAWINRSVNNGEAGDFRRYCVHYDVIVMWNRISKMVTILFRPECINALYHTLNECFEHSHFSSNLYSFIYSNEIYQLRKYVDWLFIFAIRGISVMLTHLPWTKWPPLRRRHFQMNFHGWKVFYFDSNFTENCS